jgi:integrase
MSGHEMRFSVLPHSEIGTFMAALRQQDGIPARALEFIVLTATRSRVVIGATWDEIDVSGRLWIISGHRVMNKTKHRVPLSDAALAILDKMTAIRQDDFVFPGNKAGQPLSQKAVLALLKRGRSDLTVQGFRHTFAEWGAYHADDFPSGLVSMAQGHTVGETWRHDGFKLSDSLEDHRRLMDAWAKVCASPLGVAAE